MMLCYKCERIQNLSEFNIEEEPYKIHITSGWIVLKYCVICIVWRSILLTSGAFINMNILEYIFKTCAHRERKEGKMYMNACEAVFAEVCIWMIVYVCVSSYPNVYTYMYCKALLDSLPFINNTENIFDRTNRK